MPQMGYFRHTKVIFGEIYSNGGEEPRKSNSPIVFRNKIKNRFLKKSVSKIKIDFKIKDWFPKWVQKLWNHCAHGWKLVIVQIFDICWITNIQELVIAGLTWIRQNPTGSERIRNKFYLLVEVPSKYQGILCLAKDIMKTSQFNNVSSCTLK